MDIENCAPKFEISSGSAVSRIWRTTAQFRYIKLKGGSGGAGDWMKNRKVKIINKLAIKFL